MPKFTIYAKETVYYEFEIEADNEEQARDKAYDYQLSFEDAYDSDWFEIGDIQEIKNA